MNKSEHKEDSSKEKFDKEKAEFGKTNAKCMGNESKENEEHKECKSGTSKERKRKFETKEENNQTWRVGNQRSRRQYSRKSSAETYDTIIKRRKSEELQNNKGAPVKLKKNNGCSKPTMQQNTANLRFLVQNKNTETDTAQHNMDEKINLFLEEQKNIFRTPLRVNSSQLQDTKEDTKAHNSSTLKINRICKGKDKEIITESSKKVLSKED
ncbi:6183_t:CDS:2 [Gigaspora margarita]|uniref:6183_t:CDS:1 n=1 Tax=Gigaspora margarita TaxID=4874 RepID=A0ABN7V2R4_GIGMA|nr:6183_t:CDS:2 [Gigaspora margarita]